MTSLPAGGGGGPRLRPAFSVLQRHYSPAKSTAPKPLTSAILAPPSPSKLPANVAASAEVSRLQNGLLCLHLLHRDAAAVDAEWRASARDKFGGRFAKLREASLEVDEMERGRLETTNVLALRRWGEQQQQQQKQKQGGRTKAAVGRPEVGEGLEEKIQGLDTVMSGLWGLSEAGGRYARLVRRFERWIDRVVEIEQGRRIGSGAGAGAGVGVPPFQGQCDDALVCELETSWKEDLSGILRRLEAWQRQLQELGEVPPVGSTKRDEDLNGKSALERMLDGANTLVDGMWTELRTMREIEREALAREEDWIEEMIARDDGDDNNPMTAGAVWRVV